jgi:hypothetical protein
VIASIFFETNARWCTKYKIKKYFCRIQKERIPLKMSFRQIQMSTSLYYNLADQLEWITKELQ